MISGAGMGMSDSTNSERVVILRLKTFLRMIHLITLKASVPGRVL